MGECGKGVEGGEWREFEGGERGLEGMKSISRLRGGGYGVMESVWRGGCVEIGIRRGLEPSQLQLREWSIEGQREGIKS